jgi:hypothetical protein
VKRFFMKSSDILMTGKDVLFLRVLLRSDHPQQERRSAASSSSLVTNPIFALKTMALAEAKLNFLLVDLRAAALRALRRAHWGRVMLIYGLLFCFLASARSGLHDPTSSTRASCPPVAFALDPIAVASLREGEIVACPSGSTGRRLARALVGAMLVATLLVSWKFGGLVDNATFKGGFGRVTRRSPKHAEGHSTRGSTRRRPSIPEGVSVGTTNRLGPHVSNRNARDLLPGETRLSTTCSSTRASSNHPSSTPTESSWSEGIFASSPATASSRCWSAAGCSRRRGALAARAGLRKPGGSRKL